MDVANGSPDLSFHRGLTVFFVIGYFAMVLVFLGLGAALFFAPQHTFSDHVRELLLWIMATLGPLIGILTGALKDQLQFHYGSSVGSKTKDASAPR